MWSDQFSLNHLRSLGMAWLWAWNVFPKALDLFHSHQLQHVQNKTKTTQHSAKRMVVCLCGGGVVWRWDVVEMGWGGISVTWFWIHTTGLTHHVPLVFVCGDCLVHPGQSHSVCSCVSFRLDFYLSVVMHYVYSERQNLKNIWKIFGSYIITLWIHVQLPFCILAYILY